MQWRRPGPGGQQAWDLFRHAARDCARRKPSEPIVAALRETHVAKPNRPQSACSLREEVDNLFRNCLGAWCRRNSNEQRTPITFARLDHVEDCAETFAACPAERENGSFYSPKDEFSDCRSWQLGDGVDRA